MIDESLRQLPQCHGHSSGSVRLSQEEHRDAPEE